MYIRCTTKPLVIISLHILENTKSLFYYTSDIPLLYTKLGAIWVLEIWKFHFLFLSLHPTNHLAYERERNRADKGEAYA